MSRIITISREFGSGGRELGKRLANALGIPCYDHEIIEMIAKENGFNEDYVANVAEKSIEAAYPLTIGHRFGMQPFQIMDQPIRVAVAQRRIVENFAKQGDCVMIGRAAGGRAPDGQRDRKPHEADRPQPCPAPPDVQRQQVGRQGLLRPVRQHHQALCEGSGTGHRQVLRGLVQQPRLIHTQRRAQP